MRKIKGKVNISRESKVMFLEPLVMNWQSKILRNCNILLLLPLIVMNKKIHKNKKSKVNFLGPDAKKFAVKNLGRMKKIVKFFKFTSNCPWLRLMILIATTL